MALLQGPCHNIFLSGNLKNNNCISITVPFDDICTNLWQLCLNQISYECLSDNINALLAISCNLITDLNFNVSHQVVKQQPILWQLICKGSKKEIKSMQFNQNWFYITNSQKEIKLTFYLLHDGQKSNNVLNLNCDVYVTMLLQRVK